MSLEGRHNHGLVCVCVRHHRGVTVRNNSDGFSRCCISISCIRTGEYFLTERRAKKALKGYSQRKRCVCSSPHEFDWHAVHSITFLFFNFRDEPEIWFKSFLFNNFSAMGVPFFYYCILILSFHQPAGRNIMKPANVCLFLAEFNSSVFSDFSSFVWMPSCY